MVSGGFGALVCGKTETGTYAPALCSSWGSEVESYPGMILLNKNGLEIAAWLAASAAFTAFAGWRIFRKRPSGEEVERARRQFLVQSGRIVDGTLLDIYDVTAEDGRTLTMLLFNYRIGGVDYECSQDITSIRGVVDATQLRAGFPCSVRYQSGNPQNSIVVAEGWSGLRERLLQLQSFDGTDPLDISHPRAGKG